ncbi:inositol monophosphatase family protein [Agreia sp. PsM10]|uniref:inositol monophosphatase family protein n=1 Tax=Agreia sp. PsM10 TaxID=3030533 RepID=UPI00263BA11E|nr:inositol monophosphatase family protein [Agreia sp. PsM10]MDN4642153.1 inositol monophosphatase family protein [Agreia sp. PsM10]
MTIAANTDLLTIARRIGLEAGALAARRRAEGVEVAATKSSIVDVVTLADREVEAYVRAAIADVRPDDGFLGEESTGTTGGSGLTWIVDPIDGTVNYLYGIPQYAVSIAVVEGGADPAEWNTLAGCVVNPANGEVFTAAQGGGAYLGSQQLQVNSGVSLEQTLLSTGFSYSAETRSRQGQVLAGILGQVRDIRRAGSASLDLCWVAAGRLDAYAERGLNPWDHAAGALVVREAGGHVGGFDGDAESIRFLLAAEATLAGELEPILRDLYASAGLI